MIVLSADGIVGWHVDGELQIHDQLPLDPARQAPSASVVFSPPREFEDLVHAMREAWAKNTWLPQWVVGDRRNAIRANFMVHGFRDDWGIQRNGWTDGRIDQLVNGQVRTVHTRRVPHYEYTTPGKPIFALACRIYEMTGKLDIVVRRLE